MAGLFDRQAEAYFNGRPVYPREWYSKLSALTPIRTLAWDVGTGNGQAAIGVAEYYEHVIATDVSEAQLKHAMQHPKVQYVHTPLSMSEDELASMLGGDGSVDLITVGVAVHWFDLPSFYSLVNRVLRKPGGVIAVWGYKTFTVNQVFDSIMKRFFDSTLPFFNPNIRYIMDSYCNLPFPFESVGIGSEGNPMMLDLPQQELSFDRVLMEMSSWSAVSTAKERGIDLLSEDVVKELEIAWGGSNLTRKVIRKAFMIAGKPRI